MKEYRFSRYYYKPRRRRKKVLLSFLILLIFAGGILYTIFFLDFYSLYTRLVDLYRVLFNDYKFLERNLESGNYNMVINEGSPYLSKKPYNARLNRYIGEAYYYISTSLTGEENEEAIERAIIYLRKGIVLSRFDELLTKSNYILGMAYFQKGPYFYELAVENLNKALDSGYNDPALYDMLGVGFYKLGVFDEAIKYLKKSEELNPKDINKLFLSYAYRDKGLNESAVKELNRLIKNSGDEAILEEAYSVLAWIDFQEGRLEQARNNLKNILTLNENSSYAHFWLGNVYEMEKDLISARKEWRTALKIDPKHVGAIEKLY